MHGELTTLDGVQISDNRFAEEDPTYDIPRPIFDA